MCKNIFGKSNDSDFDCTPLELYSKENYILIVVLMHDWQV